MHQIFHLPQLCQERAPIPPSSASVTTTTLRPACQYLPASIPPFSNGVVVFLQATTGELLPTCYKGSSTQFPTEKTGMPTYTMRKLS